jgi:hypothetical protein
VTAASLRAVKRVVVAAVVVVVVIVGVAVFFGSAQARPFEMDASVACLRDRPENISPLDAPPTMPFIINMWGPEVTGTLRESYPEYFRSMTPDGMKANDLFPPGTRGISMVFIPKSTFDDEATIWIFPSRGAAQHYYEVWRQRASYELGDLVIRDNAVIDHPFSSPFTVGSDYPRYDETQPLLLGCLRR